MKHRKPMLSNSNYDALKFLAQIALPGLGTLYFVLAQIWGLPKGEEVVGTITAIDVFLGLLLGLSTKKYNSGDTKYDGTIEVIEMEEKKIFSLNLDSDPDDLDSKKEVVFKVKSI